MSNCTAFREDGIAGVLHVPDNARGGLVLTHGAGANCEAPLLVTVAQQFQNAGYYVLRCDLPFRQARRAGPPHPSHAAADREGLRRAVQMLEEITRSRVCLGGHSYGGRQASMLAAENPGLVDRLLLLSYPLHPPNKPDQLRTAHFVQLETPALFVHGDADPFGSVTELQVALTLLPGPHRLSIVERTGHDLKRGKFDVANRVLLPFSGLAAA